MPRLSSRTRDLRGSPVRAMLEVSMRPEVISFAGGLPAPETFADLDLPEAPRDLFQYGPTEGEPALRARIAEELAASGLQVPAEQVIVLSGSQQGIDLVAKLVVDPGTPVAVESPSYLAALQVFRFFGADFRILAPDLFHGGGWEGGEPPALAYVIPTFQNPTGRCWSLGERKAIAEACRRDDVVLFEDDPYRDLVYAPCERTPAASFMDGGSWVYQSSFSKTVAPGLRLGFLAASPDLITPLSRLKQASDLHTNRVSQWAALTYLNDPARPERMRRLVEAYKTKRDRFDAALRRHFGNLAQWETPPGGLFFWVRFNAPMDMNALLEAAMAKNVLFTPAEHFLARPGDANAMRLNFSHASEDDAERGLAILAEAARALMAPAGTGS